MPIHVVTDSTADIDPARAAELGITVVPLFVVFGNESLRDYIDISRQQFFDRLGHDPILPTTSQPSAAMFEEAFAPAAARGEDILCITISSVLSGTINAARAAAERIAGVRIELFDSMNAAGGLQFFVEDAARMAADGASMEDILAHLTAMRDRTPLYATLPDLSHVQRTGRIGRAAAVLGGLMKIVPILTLEAGAVVSRSQVRTFKRARETMVDLICSDEKGPAPARFRVIHTQAPELATQMRDRIVERNSGREISIDIVEAGPVIAVHAGAGAIGVVATDAFVDRRTARST